MKILVATEKPFAPVAVQGIREVIEEIGRASCRERVYVLV